jgi:hypothetical protein
MGKEEEKEAEEEKEKRNRGRGEGRSRRGGRGRINIQYSWVFDKCCTYAELQVQHNTLPQNTEGQSSFNHTEAKEQV